VKKAVEKRDEGHKQYNQPSAIKEYARKKNTQIAPQRIGSTGIGAEWLCNRTFNGIK
jgi:hypothetical protein